MGVLVHVCLYICKRGAYMFGSSTCACSHEGQRKMSGAPLHSSTLFHVDKVSHQTWSLGLWLESHSGPPFSTHIALGWLQPLWALQVSQI